MNGGSWCFSTFSFFLQTITRVRGAKNNVLHVYTKFRITSPMAIITMRIDDTLKKKMEAMRQINWSEVARRAIEEKIRQLELWQPLDVEKLREASKDTDSLRRT